MRFGVLTPVVIRSPGQFSAWEATPASTSSSPSLEAADRLGYHHLTCSEHVAVPASTSPRSAAAPTGTRSPTFGYLAGAHQRIGLATHVLVLGYHHPLAIAKRYGTLDRSAAAG